MNRKSALVFASGLILGAVAASGWRSTFAQGPGASPPQRKLVVSREKFEFDVIQGVNAKYLGDTPALLGRQGAIEGFRPNVALGDPVYRGDKTLIGRVSSVEWDRSKNALTIEFDPEPFQDVAVGETAWIALDGSTRDKHKP